MKNGPWAMGHGPWAMGNGPWEMGHGKWAMGNGPWEMGHGKWAMGNGPWEMGHGKWAMGNGPWEMGHGKWAMGNGPWEMGHGKWAMGNGKLEMGNEKQAEEERFPNILRRDDEKGGIFKIAEQMARTKQDVVGEMCIRNDHENLAFDDCTKEKAWKKYYSQLLNKEFEWVKDGLSSADPILGPAVRIKVEWMKKSDEEQKGS